MRPIIEFCAANMACGTESVMKRFELDPDCDVIEYGCLGNCGQCFYGPYALVNGEMVEAVDPEELYDKIKRIIAETEDPYAWLDDED